MKKYLLLTFFLTIFFGFSNISFAARYGNHPVTYPNGTTVEGKTPCNDDSDGITDPIAVAENNSSTKLNPHGTTPLNVFPSGTMYCLYWDGQNPTVDTFSYPSGWTKNTTIALNFTISDTGGSNLNTYTIERNIYNISTSTWLGWNILTTIPLSPNQTYSALINTTGANGYGYKYRISVKDVAGNTSLVNDPGNIIYIDTTPPSAGDISGTGVIKNGTYIKANNLENFSISVDNNGGSPITFIEGEFEQYDNPLLSYNRNIIGEDNNLILNINENISDVNKYLDTVTNGYRNYTFKIKEIRDKAGNVTTTGLPSYNYYVYADNIDTGKSSVYNTLNYTTNIADGSNNILKVTLEDQYGNQIVPVPGITRTVSLVINYDNDLYLNQYAQSGNTSVFANYGINDLGIIIGNLKSTNSSLIQNSSNGVYDINFNVYSPTQNNYNKAFGNFSINSIIGNLSDLGNTTLNNSNINFSFKPIYETTITSDVKTNGFIFSGTQTGTINVTQTTLGTFPTPTLYLEFGSGGTATTSPGISPLLNLKLTSPLKQISGTSNNEGHGNLVDYGTFTIGSDLPLNTNLTQSGVVDNTAGQYLSSHIEYSLGGKTIRYNGDILGKTNYWASPISGFSTTNQGLKIGGIITSQNQTDITTNQGQNDLHIVGNVSKTILKRDMRKNVYNLINQVSINNGGNKITDLNGTGPNPEIWENSDGKTTLSGTLLYFGNLGGSNVTLNVDPNTNKVTGKKTIVVVGGNLYIKSNVVNSGASDILGIIVLKDDDGNGGNLYIDPDVTRIDAVIYTDKSLISYDGTKELDGTTNQAVLANQLYINGSVFSENTIGGSIKTPPVCPYYVTGTCDQTTAQKYDLNYLRRYYYVSGTTAINGGINYFGIYNPSYPNYLYPVVIKYNPQIQSDPPPLFGN